MLLLPRGVSNAGRTIGDPCGVGKFDSQEFPACLPCSAAGGNNTGPLLGLGLGVQLICSNVSTSAARRTSMVSGSRAVGDFSCANGVLGMDALPCKAASLVGDFSCAGVVLVLDAFPPRSFGTTFTSSAGFTRGLARTCSRWGVASGLSTGNGGDDMQSTFPCVVLSNALLFSAGVATA